MFNLLTTNERFTGLLPSPYELKDNTPFYTGRQALSMILPERLNTEMATNSYDDDKSREENMRAGNLVVIKNGEILAGTFDKSAYQKSTKGIVHSVFNEYGPDETRKLYDHTQKLICDWLVYDGFSVGISDLVVDHSTKDEFKKIIHDMKVKAYDVIRSVHDGTFENNSTYNNHAMFENSVNRILNEANKNVGNKGLANIHDYNNRMINMIKSKSKGNTINVAQMIGCVGQQNVDGRRIPYGFDDRTLPHYAKYDDGPDSRGFVENSFITGLTPQEFFFHAMGGREGLIDTAVNTSEVGYLQRKLVKAMEDCKVNYDMSVRNAAGVVIQYLYGEDGMDACKLENQSLPYIRMDVDKIKAIYNLIDGVKDFEPFLDSKVIKELKKSQATLKERMQVHYDQVMADREHIIMNMFKGNANDVSLSYPVSFQRIISNIENIKGLAAPTPSDLSPEYVLDTIESLCKELVVTKSNPGNLMLQMLVRAFLTPKFIICKHKLDKKAFDTLVEQIKFRFFESLATPSEMVGVVAAQSIGEPATQLVLNSVAYDTELLINRNGVLERVKIGEFIDNYIPQATKVEDHPNDTKLAWLDENMTILSCNEDGKVAWDRIEAVTRHPVVNKDGSNTVLRVTTRSGRSVIATKGKSFLKRINNKITQCNGEDLCVGDFLPVSKILPIKDNVPIIYKLDVSKYLPKKEYVYMSEVHKAIECCKMSHSWWKDHSGKDFVVPYNRSDSFYASWISKKKKCAKHKDHHRNDCVYPMTGVKMTTHIPEFIPLDEDFGFFMGAYLAEGMVCSSTSKKKAKVNMHHVLIANCDKKYLDRVQAFTDKYNAKFHMDDRYINNGHSVTMRIHSMILAELMNKLCGNGSPNKRVPAFVHQAPDEFLKALIDGYFSGDGCVGKEVNHALAGSVSRGLLDDIQQILVRFGITSTIKPKNMEQVRAKLARTHPDRVVVDDYTLMITGLDAQRFAETFTMTIDYKQNGLNRMLKTKPSYKKYDNIPNVVTKTYGTIMVKRGNLPKLIARTKDVDDIKTLSAITEEDIVYDQIVAIEEIPNPTPWVYDLTVENTRNFNLYSGLAQADTFHSAGISSASAAVRGVPRLNELLAVSKNIKSPMMKVFLKPTVNKDKKKCMNIMNDIRTIRFRDVVTSSKIYFDPDDLNTTIPEDAGILKIYNEFSAASCNQQFSPWVMRLEFDRFKMLEYKLDMIKLHQVLDNFYDDTVHCVFSDDNAQKLIMRIKLKMSDVNDDILTDLKALEHNILETIVIKGVKNVERVALEEQKRSAKYDPITKSLDGGDDKSREPEWSVITVGTNLREVLMNPVVDSQRTITNDVNEIYEMMGIEAARAALLNEILDVLGEIKVNYRHISLLVDVMTNRGIILSVNRHGINRGDIGPLAKCSFEETTDKLIKAGIFAELDKINGVSANVMLGQIAPCGTGEVQVVIDEDVLHDIIANEQTVQLFDANDDEDDLDDVCHKEAFHMQVPAKVSPSTTTSRKTDNAIVFVD